MIKGVSKRGKACLEDLLPTELRCLRGALAPLFNNPSPSLYQEGKLEGALAPSETIVPLPLVKGKGIQGIGLLNKNLMGVR